MSKVRLFMGLILLSAVMIVTSACGQTTSPSTTPTPPTVTYTEPELEYQLIANFPDLFWVDRDFYPIARVGQEQTNAEQQFPAISANVTTFSAILAHLGLPNKASYTDNETLAIYREYKLLSFGVQMTPSSNGYDFVLRTGQNQGERIEGNITLSGVITVTSRQPSFNTYPICLTAGTLIDTPDGQIPVEQLRADMPVWSVDSSGNRISVLILKTSKTLVPSGFRVVKVTLSDGRSVTASPGHPSADGRALGEYKAGDTLDGATVISVASLAYDGGATYDILPASPTGVYRANGILLMSTLEGN